MFWKSKSRSEKVKGPETQLAARPEKSASEKMQASAEVIASELRNYEMASLDQERREPDVELLEAQKKLNAARKIVRDGRLSYALIRQLLHHVAHWPSWISRSDFQKYVSFDASEISAFREELEGKFRSTTKDTISFVFEDVKYTCVILDKGYSQAPGDTYRFGEVEFWDAEELALKLSIIEDYSKEYSHWEFGDVLAFHSGEWMTALIKMASQIEQRERQMRDSFLDEQVIDAGKNINLDPKS